MRTWGEVKEGSDWAWSDGEVREAMGSSSESGELRAKPEMASRRQIWKDCSGAREYVSEKITEA